MADERSAEELAFEELAEVVREKDESGLTFSRYIERLERRASWRSRGRRPRPARPRSSASHGQTVGSPGGAHPQQPRPVPLARSGRTSGQRARGQAVPWGPAHSTRCPVASILGQAPQILARAWSRQGSGAGGPPNISTSSREAPGRWGRSSTREPEGYRGRVAVARRAGVRTAARPYVEAAPRVWSRAGPWRGGRTGRPSARPRSHTARCRLQVIGVDTVDHRPSRQFNALAARILAKSAASLLSWRAGWPQ